MASIPMINGIPALGLGTFGLTGEAGAKAIGHAISLGYTHIDTSQTYDTESSVGAAIAQCGVPRDKLFVTTKVAETNLGRVQESMRDSLAVLGMDYVDLALIHWPDRTGDRPVAAYVSDLARVQDAGLARAIGVSNFTRKHIDDSITAIGPGRLSTNQVECHVYLQNRLLADHCRDHDIAITAYEPIFLGLPDPDPVLDGIADRLGATRQQVALAHLRQLGHIAIPKSGHPGRQADNLASLQVTLSDDDMTAIAALDSGRRNINPSWAPDWD